MQGHEVGLTLKHRVNWKRTVQKRFDQKRFKEEQEEVYKNYLKEIQTERLTIKEAISFFTSATFAILNCPLYC